MSCELPVFDKGTSIEITIRDCGGVKDPQTGLYPLVDLTGADSLVLVMAKPDDAETVIERTGEIFTGGTAGDGTDGIMQYVTVGTDIDVIGTWKLQAIVTFNTVPPKEYQSNILEVPVAATLRNPG